MPELPGEHPGRMSGRIFRKISSLSLRSSPKGRDCRRVTWTQARSPFLKAVIFGTRFGCPFTVQFAPVHGHCMKYHAYQQDTHPHAKSFLTQNDRVGWWLLPCSPAWPAAFCPFSFRSRYMSRGAPGQLDRCFSSAFLLLIAFDPRRTRLKASGRSAALPSLLL